MHGPQTQDLQDLLGQLESRAIFDPCRAAWADLVVMASFLERLTIADDFTNCETNVHLGLIPALCGHGFHGHHVHQAVLDYGAKRSVCTVHFADNQYDHGPVILQKPVSVLDDDTVETLAGRVFAAEGEVYPKAIELIAQARVKIEGRKVRTL
jgi:folate-dependent phosphoribosylglycinamide formyltransferase PurN